MVAKPTVAWNGTEWVNVTVPVRPGLSAYEVAVQAGYEGTVSQWLASMVGPQGPVGPRGPSGTNGISGAPGPIGPGLPPGGTTGQWLAKASTDDYDLEWIDAPNGVTSTIYPEDSLVGGTKTIYTDAQGIEWELHTWSTVGTSTATVSATVGCQLLVVGGGGGGGNGNSFRGGGGGGGGAVFSSARFFTPDTYSVTVGGGGAAAVSGGDSKFGQIWCYGGGRGGNAQNNGANGGCGGGAGQDGGAGTATYGSLDGGATTDSTLVIGENGLVGSGRGGFGGGARVTTDITGTTVEYSKRGEQSPGGSPGTGPAGTTPGSGGGGGGTSSSSGGPGANGIVVVRYRIG